MNRDVPDKPELVVDFSSAHGQRKGPPEARPRKKSKQPAEVEVLWSDSFLAIADEFSIELDLEPPEEALRRQSPPEQEVDLQEVERREHTSETRGGDEAESGDSIDLVHLQDVPKPVSLSPLTKSRTNNIPRPSRVHLLGSTPSPRREKTFSSPSTLSHADHLQQMMGVSMSTLSRAPVLRVGGDRINALRNPSQSPSRHQEFDFSSTRVSPVPQVSPVQQARAGLLHSSKAAADAIVPEEPSPPPEDISQFTQCTPALGSRRQKKRKRSSAAKDHARDPRRLKRQRRDDSLLSPDGTPMVKDEPLSGACSELDDSQYAYSALSHGQLTPSPFGSPSPAKSQLLDSQGHLTHRSGSSASELRMRAHSQRLKVAQQTGRNDLPPASSDEQTDEELLNEALLLVARLEGDCRHQQRLLAKLAAQHRHRRQELAKLTKRRDALKKKAVKLQKRILAANLAESQT